VTTPEIKLQNLLLRIPSTELYKNTNADLYPRVKF